LIKQYCLLRTKKAKLVVNSFQESSANKKLKESNNLFEDILTNNDLVESNKNTDYCKSSNEDTDYCENSNKYDNLKEVFINNNNLDSDNNFKDSINDFENNSNNILTDNDNNLSTQKIVDRPVLFELFDSKYDLYFANFTKQTSFL
ncbi:33917_t:CDS:2, partial [Racocetra persica]